MIDWGKEFQVSAVFEDEAKHIMQILDDNGCLWNSGDPLRYYTNWKEYGERTLYSVRNHRVLYGSQFYQDCIMYSYEEFLNELGIKALTLPMLDVSNLI